MENIQIYLHAKFHIFLRSLIFFPYLIISYWIIHLEKEFKMGKSSRVIFLHVGPGLQRHPAQSVTKLAHACFPPCQSSTPLLPRPHSLPAHRHPLFSHVGSAGQGGENLPTAHAMLPCSDCIVAVDVIPRPHRDEKLGHATLIVAHSHATWGPAVWSLHAGARRRRRHCTPAVTP
jgi:hypothetical protein